MKIIMKLKSDAIPGSGKSLAGIIDRDIAYDKFGLPYIPAKRIKGILRESAEELGIDEDKLFGIEGSARGCEFHIDNGYLEGYQEYKKLLSSKSGNRDISNLLPQQAILDFFTYTRSQTTIENGVAKENSLRISRVLKKGLRFEFNVDYNQKHKDDLNTICNVTRAFGASRTRGFGEITLKLETSQHNEVSEDHYGPDKNDLSETAKMKIVMENQGQLLISSIPGKNQISEDYINGASLLGAIATNYIKENTVDEKFKELFLSGSLSFGNLYPTSGKSTELFYPSPLSIKKVKENKTNDNLNEYYDHSELDEDNKIPRDVIFKGGYPQFVSADINQKISTLKDIEAHHRRPSDRHIAKAKDGEFYQFEVIEKDQNFSGEIVGKRELLNELKEYFPKNQILRLGKSKTGQYGRCKCHLSTPETISEEKFEWSNGKEEKIIFRSDMILVNENGFVTPDINIFKKDFAFKLGIKPDKLEITKQFSSTTNTGGFWGVWKMPRIQKPAINAGTVVVIKNNSGKDLTADSIETLMFGDRIEDGFGRIAIYENDKFELSSPSSPDPENEIYDLDEIPDKVKDLINFQVRKIVIQNLQSKALENAKPAPVNSFIGKLVSYLKSSESFETFNNKIGELKSKQKDNLRKIAKDLFINNGKVIVEIAQEDNNSSNNTNFKNEVDQSQNRIPNKIKEKFKTEPDFELYRHYALAYLTQVKFLNRRGGK